LRGAFHSLARYDVVSIADNGSYVFELGLGLALGGDGFNRIVAN
jgi:hypothetical protein